MKFRVASLTNEQRKFLSKLKISSRDGLIVLDVQEHFLPIDVGKPRVESFKSRKPIVDFAKVQELQSLFEIELPKSWLERIRFGVTFLTLQDITERPKDSVECPTCEKKTRIVEGLTTLYQCEECRTSFNVIFGPNDSFEPIVSIKRIPQ